MKGLLCILLLLNTIVFQAQSQSLIAHSKLTIIEGDTIVYYADIDPVFPGGEEPGLNISKNFYLS